MPVVFGPTAASPTRASLMTSPSAHTAAPEDTIAQSPARRSTFSYALEPPGRRGMRISVSISAAADGGLVRAAVELAHRDHPFAGAAADDTRRVERGADGRKVLGRIGLAQRAAERAAVANHGIGDDSLGVAEDGEGCGQLVGFEQLAMAGHRADPERVAVATHVAQLPVKIVDVHEVLEVREPQLHHRQETVAAGDQAGLRPQPLEESDGVVDAGGAFVFERRGYLHEFPLCQVWDHPRVAVCAGPADPSTAD